MGQSKLVVFTAALVGIAALIHIVLGIRGIGAWLSGGDTLGILPPLFVLSGVGILGGMSLTYRGYLAPQPAYFLGVGMMVVYIVGYVDWHALGYTEALLGLDDAGHSHDHEHNGGHDDDHGHGHDDDHGHSHDSDSALATVIDHLRADMVDLVSKVTEAVAAVLLSVLALTAE